jgi:DNA recombination protein Rad52
MSFTAQQVSALGEKLNASHVKQREQAGRKLSYIEGWHAIAEANRIFGFHAWDRATIDMKLVSERERKIGRAPSQKDGWAVGYIARVRVLVRFDGGECIREGTGYGSGIDVDLGAAHESAIKEAETDAMKRALMTFGNPFGLALYDKEQENVEREAPRPTPSQQRDPREEIVELGAVIRDEIDHAPDVQGVNALMVRRGFVVGAEEPKPGSDLDRIRNTYPKGYEALLDRANKRRAALVHKPESNAA